MQVKVKIYSKQKQTKTDKVTGQKNSSTAEITRETTDLYYSDTLPFEVVKTKAIKTAIFILSSRYQAFIEVDKKLPSILFASIVIDGEVFSSETVLVKTKMEHLVRVSMANLKKMPITQVIPEIMKLHTEGLKSSLGHYSRIKARIAEDNATDEYEGNGDTSFSELAVSSDGVLA